MYPIIQIRNQFDEVFSLKSIIVFVVAACGPNAVSDGDHEKLSKKEILLGRRKDKKDKKDRGYATLDGESSPEEELDTK